MLTPKIFTHTPKFNPEPVIFFGVIFRRFGGGFFYHHKKGGWDARGILPRGTLGMELLARSGDGVTVAPALSLRLVSSVIRES